MSDHQRRSRASSPSMVSPTALTIAEEILLLILDGEKGEFRISLPPHSRDIVIAGAALMDLTLANRIDTDLEQLVVVDSAPMNDDLLDPILTDIVAAPEARDTAFWLTQIATRGEELRSQAIARLVKHGILEAETNGLVFLSRLVARARKYSIGNDKTTEEVHFRIMRTIYSDEIPDPRDLVIISLASACGVFNSIFPADELAEVSDRIEQLARLDLIGREVALAVGRIKSEPPKQVAARPHEEIPLARGWPLAGSAFEMNRDIGKFLTTQYLKLGPVFRCQAFHQRFTIIAGPEAVTDLPKLMNTHMRSYDFWQDYIRSTGTARQTVNMDGEEHLRMRKFLAKSFTPKFLEGRVDQLIELTRAVTAEWPRHQPITTMRAMQSIISEQMGVLFASASPREHMDELSFYLKTKLMIHVLRRWPKQMEWLPRYRRAERTVKRLCAETLAAHQPELREGVPPDHVDEVLAMNREDPQFMPESDYQMHIIGPFFAGLDTTASTCSFILYNLLKHPDVLAQMKAEVDAVFDRGTPTEKELRSLDVTRRVFLETLRLYPVIPAILRNVCNPFEFGGYKIPVGTQVLVGATVAHHLPEYYPDPERFDIERYHRNPPEHRAPGAYAPFGLGRHRCAGSGFAEVQAMVTMATLIHDLDFKIDQSLPHCKVINSPTAQPDQSFTFQVTAKRSATA